MYFQFRLRKPGKKLWNSSVPRKITFAVEQEKKEKTAWFNRRFFKNRILIAFLLGLDFGFL